MSAVMPVTITPVQSLPAAVPAQDDDSDTGFSFGDLIDMVNPLQHIPVVGTLYRRITGDTINTVPKLSGDTAYEVADNLINGRAPFDDGTPAAGDASSTTAIAPNDSPSLFDRIENLISSSPAQAPIDTTATAVASNAPQLTAPAVVADASLDTLVIPGQESLVNAIRQVGTTADAVLRGSHAYHRAMAVHAVNTGAKIPSLRATLD